MVQPIWKLWMFLKKLKIPYHPALLGVYLEKIMIQKSTCNHMAIAAVFTIAKAWKQPKCPSKDEWIKMIWYI